MACRPLHCTCLLPSKDVLVKVELELFIGNVDTELLKGVAAEVLEAKNVQNANVPQLNRPCYESQNAETLYHTAQQTHTHHQALQLSHTHPSTGGLRAGLILFTIQLNSRPYSALAMASRTSIACSTVFRRTMVSPWVATRVVVTAFSNASALILRRPATTNGK